MAADEAEKEAVSWWNSCSSSVLSEVDNHVQFFDSKALFKRYRCTAAQRLSGGFVNFVCRAFLETSVSSQDGSIPVVQQGSTFSSVIVKRFASSIHNAYSYEIERTALWLCNSTHHPAPASEQAIWVRVPQLLAFDDASRTIVMEDAGANAKMLSEWLTPAAAATNDVTPLLEEGTAADIAFGWPELTTDKFAKAIADMFVKNRVASIAARLLPSSGDITLSPTSPPFDLQLRPPISLAEQLQWHSHFSAQALAFGVPLPIVEALAPVSSNPFDQAALPAADASIKRSAWRRRADTVHDGWDWSVVRFSGISATDSSDASSDSNKHFTSLTTATDRFSPADPSLIVGDLWPNSVLIDPAQCTLWIVDWEAAAIGHSGRDVALLIDHLWIMTQNSAKYDTLRAKKLICSLASVFSPALSGDAGSAATLIDWRMGREPEFLRSVAMFAGSPHYGIDHSSALRCALGEISALSSLVNLN